MVLNRPVLQVEKLNAVYQDKICSDSEQVDKGPHHAGEVNQCTSPAIKIRLVN